MAIAQREGSSRLLDKMEKDDVLIVTKLDRLGRDAIDVRTTVAKLEDIGIRVHCLALGGVGLRSSAGKMTMGVINAVAQFERDLLVERTQSGLARGKDVRFAFTDQSDGNLSRNELCGLPEVTDPGIAHGGHRRSVSDSAMT